VLRQCAPVPPAKGATLCFVLCDRLTAPLSRSKAEKVPYSPLLLAEIQANMGQCTNVFIKLVGRAL